MVTSLVALERSLPSPRARLASIAAWATARTASASIAAAVIGLDEASTNETSKFGGSARRQSCRSRWPRRSQPNTGSTETATSGAGLFTMGTSLLVATEAAVSRT